jgi:hypothetical protein
MYNQTNIEFGDIGVLLLGYNRPEFLQRRIIELSNSLLENIHISIDGGSESHTPEMYGMQILAKKVLKDRLSEFYHHKERKGLVLHITGEISKVLLNYKYIIVLEDDVKTAKNFDINMLNGLRTQHKLGFKGIVSGCTPFFSNRFKNKWRKTYMCYVWGWACSAEFWSGYDHDLSGTEIEKELSGSSLFKKLSNYEKNNLLKTFRKVQKDILSTWDAQLLFYTLKNDFINICPVFSISGNEGFEDLRATHTKGKKPKNILNSKINTRIILGLSNYSYMYKLFEGNGFLLNRLPIFFREKLKKLLESDKANS